MNKLLAFFGKAVKGVLTGFDRIVFKGTILPLAHEGGAMGFLRWRGVLNRDYKKWMQAQTDALVTSVDRYAREQSGRPITHLKTWRTDKEELARKRQKQTGIETGLIGVWSCLESGWSYRAHYCAEKGYPQLHRYTTQCKHLYLYLDHEQYGWMSVRLQTWFPYHIQIAINGREWLRRRLEARHVDFLRQGNKFLHVEDYALAQRFLRQQLDRRWPRLLNSILRTAFPTMSRTLGPHLSYYWTLWQSEWATDFVMERPADLTATMASLLRHALITGNATRVLRCFAVSGITNAALRKKLCTTSWGAGRTDRQLSARVSRHLRLLRDHGLIRKLPNRHRYHLTNNGRQRTSALHAMLSASTEQLLKMAA